MRRARRGAAVCCGWIALATFAGCSDRALDERAQATCDAVSAEHFDEALALSAEGSSASGAGRPLAECRCIAFLSLSNREGCTSLLGPLLREPAAADWVPHPVLTKLMVRTWQAEGDLDDAARLATRAAPLHHDDLELLQLELALRSSLEDEDAVLAEIETRLGSDPSWTAERLVLSLAWRRRARFDDALRVLGSDPPPLDHPLVLPWYESKVAAQAAAGDLAAVQATFAEWRRTGWDPIDLEARYALRISTGQLVDPEHNTIDLLRGALAHQDQIRDRKLLWGLHRRLITDLLAAGRPELALEAYDEAIKVVPLDGITREEIERAVRVADGSIASDDVAQLRFAFAADARGGELWISPGPDEAPDSGYRAHPIASDAPIVVSARPGLHPLRWVVHDAKGATRASGAVWPEPGHATEIRPTLGAALAPASWTPTPRPPADGRRRVFVILGDCADWRLTEYLRARGELPFENHLFEDGYRAVLESRPAFTAAAMQSLVWPAPPAAIDTLGWIQRFGLELGALEAVGRNPVGWLSWVLPERPNLFETLGAGPLVTANMLLAHGRIEAGRHAELIGPAGEHRNLSSISAQRALRADELERYPTLMHDPDTKKFSETIAAEMDSAERIAREGRVDFLFLRLEALDLLTHAHFGALDGRGQDDAQGPLLDAYRYIDERLAGLEGVLDQDDWLVYLSDHGIRSSMQHEEDAVFVAIGEGVPTGRAPGQPSLRGVPRSLAAMLGVETDWPAGNATPWLGTHEGHSELAAQP
jgi:tetratricopeptide (TPR) repeat protein